MECSEEPISTSIPGKHTSSAIRTVCCRCEAEYDNARIRVTKPTNWSTPILLIAIRRPTFNRHTLTPLHQTFAGMAVPNLVLQSLKIVDTVGRRIGLANVRHDQGQ